MLLLLLLLLLLLHPLVLVAQLQRLRVCASMSWPPSSRPCIRSAASSALPRIALCKQSQLRAQPRSFIAFTFGACANLNMQMEEEEGVKRAQVRGEDEGGMRPDALASRSPCLAHLSCMFEPVLVRIVNAGPIEGCS